MDGVGEPRSDQLPRCGRFALESHDLQVTIGRAMELVAAVTGASMVWLILVVGAGRVMVLGNCGPLGVRAGDRVDVPEDFLAAYDSGRPVIVTDWHRETRFGQAPVLRDAGVRSTLSVGVLIAGATCRLTVHDVVARPFGEVDVGAVQTIGYLLAAAVDRHHQERAQAAVADFGRFALQSRETTTTVARAVDEVTETLDAPMGAVSRPSGPDRLTLVHGRGPIGLAPGEEYPVPVELVAEHQDGAGALVVEDWRTETRFAQSAASRASGVRSSLSVGFPVGDQVWRIGVLDTAPRRFRGSEVDFVQSMAHLLATAVERQQAELRLRESNRQLQHALLPGRPPALPGIRVAVRYIPAGGDQVGGDWYDVLPLPYGGIGLVMGDVEGHDQTAAGLMAQVRHVVRAYAVDGHTPAEILAGVNRFVSDHLERLVTCCFVELDVDQRTATCVSAGHPAPLVLNRGPVLEPLPFAPGMILGVCGDQDYREHTVLLPEACALLMVTDGLVDDFAGAVHHGVEALAAVATASADEPIEVLADRLTAPAADGPGPRDDAALLAVQITTAVMDGCGRVRRTLPNRPIAAQAARTFVDDVLTAWHLGALCEPAVLGVSELVTNAVVHTSGPIEVCLQRAGPDRIRVAVHDGSEQLPRAGPPALQSAPTRLDPGGLDPGGLDPGGLDPGGRGLLIVEHLTDRWGIETATMGAGRTDGKTVWFEVSA